MEMRTREMGKGGRGGGGRVEKGNGKSGGNVKEGK